MDQLEQSSPSQSSNPAADAYYNNANNTDDCWSEFKLVSFQQSHQAGQWLVHNLEPNKHEVSIYAFCHPDCSKLTGIPK
jgi:hypothetical protein